MKTNKLNSRIVQKKFRNGKIYMNIVIDYLDKVSGKRCQKTKSTGFTSEEYNRGKKKEVDAMRQQFVEDFEKELGVQKDGEYDGKKMTVMEFMEKWRKNRELNICPASRKKDFDYIRMLPRFLLATRQI